MKSVFKFVLFSIVALLIGRNCLMAQTAVNRMLSTTNLSFGHYTLLVDSAGIMSALDVYSKPDSEFITLADHQKIALPNIKYWLKCNVYNQSTEPIIMEFLREFDEIEVYSLSKDQIPVYIFKNKMNWWERAILYVNPLVFIPNHYGTQTLLIKLKTQTFTGLGFVLYQASYIINIATKKMLIYLVYLAMLVILILISLVLAFNLRDSAYLFYSLYILSLFIFSFMIFGFGFFIFNYFSYSYLFYSIPYQCMMLFLILYVWNHLKITLQYTWLNYFFVALLLFETASIIGSFFNPFLTTISPFTEFCASAFLVSAIYYVALKKQLSDKLLVITISLFFFSNLYHTLINYKVIQPSSGIQQDSLTLFILFSVAEVVSLSLALSNRFNVLNKLQAKQQIALIESQQQLITEIQEKKELQTKLNEELEKLVSDRTKSLNRANRILQMQTDEIRAMNEQLLVQNTTLSSELAQLSNDVLLDTNLTYSSFLTYFPDHTACLQFLSELKWSKGFYCTKCGFNKYYIHNSYLSRKCKRCKHTHTVLTGSVLENVKFELTKALYLVYVNATSKQIIIKHLSSELNMRPGTCSGFIKKIQQALASKHNKPSNWLQSIYGP